MNLTLRLDPALGERWLAPIRFQQVMWNLVGNAIKFTPAGGSVTVTGERKGDEVTLEVIDTGDGIRADVMPLIFKALRPGAAGDAPGDRRARPGALSISQHLRVQLHGGTLRAESDGPGKGSTFTVHLPLRPLGAERRAARGEAPVPQVSP